MRRRKGYLPWLVCAAVAMTALPALAAGRAAPPAGAFVVSDDGFRDAAPAPPLPDSTVEIAAGGTVTWSYTSGTKTFNVVFDGPQPASCQDLPATPQGPAWEGECTFAAPGTYAFHSGEYEYTGTVIVRPTEAAIVAHDDWFQDGASADKDDASVTVPAGGKVTFNYPAGQSAHNVKFEGSQPECTQTAGTIIPELPVPPLPNYAQPPGWAGYCTFAGAGTYAFVCSAHPDMRGTVVVEGEPTSSPSPSPSPSATPTPPPAPAFEAHDNFFRSTSGDTRLTVEPGTAVGFSYLEGDSAHNVRFAPLQPAECRQTAGPSIGAVPPLPPAALGPGWTGDCRFDAPGDYTFVCSVHSEMTGTVSVRAPAAQISVTPPPAPPVRDGTPAPRPRAWARLDRAKVKRGRLTVTARCVSAGRGKVTLTVSKAVARRLKLRRRTLGAATARCDGHGRMTVSIRLNKRARRALARRHRLKVTATLKLAGRRADRRRLTLEAK